MTNKTAFEPRWKNEVAHLDYRLGPWRLRRIPLSLRVTREYLAKPIEDLEELKPLLQSDMRGLDGVLLFAHRAQGQWPRVVKMGGWLIYTPSVYERFMTNLTLGTEGYWVNFSGKTRSTLRRKVKLFTQASGGEIDLRKYTQPTEMEEFHRLALPVSLRTYQYKLFKGGLPEDPKFLDRMRESAARGDVRAYLLFKDGEAVAYIYFEAENGILSYSYVGHEAELSQLSPGTVLMTVAMEDLCQEGHFNWLDFGYGTGQHKSVFSSETVRVAHVYLLKRNTRNFLLVHSHSALNRATETLTKLLVRLDIHQRIKRFVRRTASVHKSE